MSDLSAGRAPATSVTGPPVPAALARLFVRDDLTASAIRSIRMRVREGMSREKASAVSCEKIMLIRHSERPSADKKFRGVDLGGRKDKEELTVRGWQRAGALVRFFAPRDGRFVHPALGRPAVLFACKAGPAAPSLRPQHTLLPLAEFLSDIELNCDYYEGEEAALVREVLGRRGPALIAWKHLTMHVIANLILGNASTAPQHWPYERYDLVWVFDRTQDGYAFTQVPQLLLAGDSADLVV